MISSQILKSSMEELHTITKVNLTVFDADGLLLCSTSKEPFSDKKIMDSFIESPADSQVVGASHLLKIYDDEELLYVLTAEGAGDEAYTVARIASSELRLLSGAYKERFDRNNFFQSLLMDNLLLVDVYNRAKKLRIEASVPRIVYVIEGNTEDDGVISELLRGMFSDKSGDFVTEIDENNVILIKALKEPYSSAEIEQTAQMIVDTISAEAMVNVRVGYGTVVPELKEVSKSYKEAMMAVDVGKIFYAERKVNSYSSLGIGRLIYQLPKNLCEVFLDEIFKDTDPASIDEEILTTVYKFFENSLNVSETSRQLFIHRNTLIYRVEKLKNLTGLDVRSFDDALTFVIAMMVYNYVNYSG